MQEPNDHELLAQFTQQNSEAAFAALVARHVNLVYSVALRKTGQPQAAEEIAQAAFIILARKARGLPSRTILAGWLCETARLTAANYLRTEIRRQKREQGAHMQSLLNEPPPADDLWKQITPLLDDALAKLGEPERNAVVLRFFENKNLRDVGAALGVSEDAAKRRVHRALEKLRKIFLKRGVTLPALALGGMLAANSVQAAPLALAATISVTAVQGSAVTASTLTLVKGALKLMAWTKVKFAIMAGMAMLLAVGAATVAISEAHGGDKLTSREIMEKCRDAYAALASYSSTGKTIEEIDGKTLTASFSMRLGRPSHYLVEYEQDGPSFTNKAAAWCAGSGDYFANDVVNLTNKLPFPGPAHNLGNLLDISGGVTAEVPALFFGIQIPEAAAKGTWSELVQPAKWDLTRLVKEPDEKLGETGCHVLSLETNAGKLRVWVGKQDFLVHRSQQWVKSRLPEVTDAEMATLLAVVPQPPPLPMEEMKRRINEARKTANNTMKPATVVFSDDQGSSGLKSLLVQPPAVIVFTQTHENIIVNQSFTLSDFTH